MTLAWPQLLWLLLLPAGLLAWELTRQRRSDSGLRPQIRRGQAGRRHFTLATGSPSKIARSRPRIWLFLGLCLAVVALARPQYGQIENRVFEQSREILLAVDLSKSMLAEDVPPSRLERAKLLIQSLLERLAGERVGLLLFSGTAFLQSPLSADYEILNEFLPMLGPDYLPAGGSNYDALLETATEAFDPDATADRFLIILSDGEATDDSWKDRVPALKERGIRVIGLGIGTTDGAMIPDGSGGFVKDERGAIVLSRLENSTLQELADETGGAYRDASDWVDLAGLLQSTVEAGRAGNFAVDRQVRLADRFQWVLAPALLFLLLSYWREFPVQPRPRPLQLTPATKSPPAGSGVRALLILIAGLMAIPMGTRARAADAISVPSVDPPETTDPVEIAAEPLSQAVARLAAEPDSTITAQEWAEMARLTVTYGNQLKSASEPVPEGPVRDALEAVDRGEALDAIAADWAQLRSDLEDLLQPPPEEEEPPPDEQPPPEQQQQQQQQQDESGNQNDQSDSNSPQSDSGDSSDQQNQASADNSAEPSDDSGSPQGGDTNSDQTPPDPSSAQSAFGDMNEESPPPAAQPPSPTASNQTQQVGGANDRTTGQKDDASLAIPLQRLDELRDQDSPATLFQLMDDTPDQPQSGKDW